MHMRPFIIALLAVALCTVVGSGESQGQLYMKNKSRDYVNKTAMIVKRTHDKLPAVSDREKRGFFAKAIKHQRFARMQYWVENYKEAIYHAHYARELAFKVFMHDNEAFPKSWEYTSSERGLLKGCPSDAELDQALIEANPGITFEDEPYVQDEELYDLEIND